MIYKYICNLRAILAFYAVCIFYTLPVIIMPPICLEKLKRTCIAINFDIKKEICEYMIINPNVNQGIVT